MPHFDSGFGCGSGYRCVRLADNSGSDLECVDFLLEPQNFLLFGAKHIVEVLHGGILGDQCQKWVLPDGYSRSTGSPLGTSRKGRFAILPLVTGVVGVSAEDGERAINLLQQHNPRDFMRQSQFPE